MESERPARFFENMNLELLLIDSNPSLKPGAVKETTNLPQRNRETSMEVLEAKIVLFSEICETQPGFADLLRTTDLLETSSIESLESLCKFIFSLIPAAAPPEREPVPLKDLESQTTENHKNSEITIKATVKKLFEPFTMSATMQVHVVGLGEPVVLKLYDRRLPAGSNLRRLFKIPGWDEERETEYHEFIRSGQVQEFINWLQGLEDEDDCQNWTPARNEAFLRFFCENLYNTEAEVYNKISDLQGHGVPKLLATVRLRTQNDPALQEYTDIPGLLISYIDGFSLQSVQEHAPREKWQAICDDAISVVNSISDRGILNFDVYPRNCIVHKTTSDSTGEIKYKPFIIDFSLARTQRSDESDEDWRQERLYYNEEGAIGLTMQGSLKKAGGGYIYHPSNRFRVNDTEGEEQKKDGNFIEARPTHTESSHTEAIDTKPENLSIEDEASIDGDLIIFESRSSGKRKREADTNGF